MSATMDFYMSIKGFQIKRDEIDKVYFDRKNELKTAEGSQMFDDGMRDARQQRKDAIESLQKESRKSIAECCEKMRDNIRSRKMTPPTAEQLAILQALKMRENVTLSELEHAAASMDGNALAIGVIGDICKKNGFHRSFSQFCKDYPESEALAVIDNLSAGAARIMETPIRRGALAAAKYHEQHHGIKFDADDLPREKPFELAADCIRELGFTFGASNAQVQAFCDAVDW